MRRERYCTSPLQVCSLRIQQLVPALHEGEEGLHARLVAEILPQQLEVIARIIRPLHLHVPKAREAPVADEATFGHEADLVPDEIEINICCHHGLAILEQDRLEKGSAQAEGSTRVHRRRIRIARVRHAGRRAGPHVADHRVRNTGFDGRQARRHGVHVLPLGGMKAIVNQAQEVLGLLGGSNGRALALLLLVHLRRCEIACYVTQPQIPSTAKLEQRQEPAFLYGKITGASFKGGNSNARGPKFCWERVLEGLHFVGLVHSPDASGHPVLELMCCYSLCPIIVCVLHFRDKYPRFLGSWRILENV